MLWAMKEPIEVSTDSEKIGRAKRPTGNIGNGITVWRQTNSAPNSSATTNTAATNRPFSPCPSPSMQTMSSPKARALRMALQKSKRCGERRLAGRYLMPSASAVMPNGTLTRNSHCHCAIARMPAAGPTVAAGILAIAQWQWLFLVNVPLGIAALALGIKYLPANRRSPHRFDFWSAILNAFAFGLLIVCIDGLGHGENGRFVAAVFVVALLFGALLVWRQTVIPFTMLPVGLFARPIFSLSVLTSIGSFIAQSMALVSLPFYFEHALGLSQVQTGLLITPWPLTIAVVAPIAGRLADRYPAGILGGIGLAVMAIGLALVAFLPAHPSMTDVAWRMTICGFGFGAFQSPNNRAILANAPRERSAGAGAIISTARLLGQTTGTAMVSLIFGLGAASAAAASHAESTSILVGAGFAAAAAIISSLRLMQR